MELIKRTLFCLLLVWASLSAQVITNPHRLGGTPYRVQLHTHCAGGIGTCTTGSGDGQTLTYNPLSVTVVGNVATAAFTYDVMASEPVWVGQSIAVSGASDSALNGTWTVTATPPVMVSPQTTAARQFSFGVPGVSNGGPYAGITISVQLTIDNAMAGYAALGYDVVALTDKGQGGSGITYQTQPTPTYPSIIQLYGMERYATNPNTGAAVHINQVNVEGPPRYTGGNVGPTVQQIVDEAHAAGGLAVLNHPQLTPNLIEKQDTDAIMGFDAIERQGYVDSGKDNATIWNYVLDKGRMVWGTSVSDAHVTSQLYGSWVTVYAAERTASDIVANLKTGNFTGTRCWITLGRDCSQGIPLTIAISGRTITATMTDATHDGQFIWSTRGLPNARVSASGVRTDSYTINGRERYVYVTFVRSDSTVSTPKLSWSQPLGVTPPMFPLPAARGRGKLGSTSIDTSALSWASINSAAWAAITISQWPGIVQ